MVSVVLFYGVGAGDSAGDGEGASTEPRVLDGFLFADLAVPDGVGDALVVAAAVVPVVPCCCVHEAINAAPIKVATNENTYFFISSVRAPENVWLLGTERTVSSTSADCEEVQACTLSNNKGKMSHRFQRACKLLKELSWNYPVLIKLMSPLRSMRATFILDKSSVAALRCISSSRSCSEI